MMTWKVRRREGGEGVLGGAAEVRWEGGKREGELGGPGCAWVTPGASPRRAQALERRDHEEEEEAARSSAGSGRACAATAPSPGRWSAGAGAWLRTRGPGFGPVLPCPSWVASGGQAASTLSVLGMPTSGSEDRRG